MGAAMAASMAVAMTASMPAAVAMATTAFVQSLISLQVLKRLRSLLVLSHICRIFNSYSSSTRVTSFSGSSESIFRSLYVLFWNDFH